jgi:MFS family permease
MMSVMRIQARRLERGGDTVARGRWAVLAVGVGAQASFSAYQQGLPALGPALQSRFQVGLTQTGVLLASASAGVMVTLLAWGLLTDRVGERPVLVTGLAGAAGALAIGAFAPGFWPLAGALVLAGMLGSCSNAATGRAVMAWFGHAQRGTALGIRQMATPLGGGVAALALPALAASGSLRTALLALAGCLLAGAAASSRWIRNPPVVRAPAAAAAGGPQAPAPPTPGGSEAPAPAAADPPGPGPVHDRRIWRLASGGALLVAGQISLVSYLTLFLAGERGWPAGRAAVVLAVVQLGGAAIRVAAGRWSDRRGVRIAPMRELALLGTCLLAATALLTRAPGVVLLPVLVVTGIVSMSSNGLNFTATGEIAGQARAGSAMGLQNTALFASGAIAPVLFGAVAEHLGWTAGFALLALLAGAGWRLLAPLQSQERAGWRRPA